MLEVPTLCQTLTLTEEEEEARVLLEVLLQVTNQEMEVQDCSLVMVIITQVVVEQVLGQQDMQEMVESEVEAVAMPIQDTVALLVPVVVLLETVAVQALFYTTTVLSLPEVQVELIQEVGAVVRTNLVIAIIEEWAVTVAQV
tara:strand:+ start:296 stop:721 length:426 start_codon:yes stop_codon:yes gene_type:complete